jgi:hypothetical protein
MKSRPDLKLNWLQYLVFFTLSAFFVFLCFHYASFLNLWGDEAASLNIAEMPIKEIFQINSIDVHSPTYYLLLKLIIAFTGSNYSNEIIIRLIHAFAFTGGLYFGYRTLKFTFKSTEFSAAVLAVTTLLPSFLFYATNVRMYAFLFGFSMWYIYTILKYLTQSESASFSRNWDIFISGLLLTGLDYIGLLYYGLGALFALLKKDKNRNRLWLMITLPPLIIFVVYLVPTKFSALTALLNGPLRTAASILTTENTSTFIVKKIFNSSRPFIELTDIAYKHLAVPLIYLFFYSIFLLSGTLILIRKYLISKDLRLLFILVIAYTWGITFFLGFSFTRLFLPSQFFMSALILYGLFNLTNGTLLRAIVFLFLISFNLYTAFFPTIHLNALIPYRQISINTLNAAKKEKIDTILISGHSESYESVSRYILQQNVPGMTIHRLDPAFSLSNIPQKRFLFLSYMGENGQFVNAQRIAKEFKRKLSIVENDVNLENLPFNSLWNKTLLARSEQHYVYVLYRVE